jgi:hypothetical protein
MAEAIGRRALVLGIAGLVVMALLALVGGDFAFRRVMFAYLANFAFVLSIGLGALLFVMIHHLCRTGAVVNYRRLGEIVAGALPLIALLAIPILLAAPQLYRWSWVATDPLINEKKPWLELSTWLPRMAIYLVVFALLGWYFFNRSRQQDETGRPKLTAEMQAVAAPGVLVYAIAITFLAFDMLMSLDAHWFSTIFGVYYFAGAFMAFHALLAVMIHRFQDRGFIRRVINAEHYHDIGKMMFAFVVFWAYIAFSQYMLIWYAALPEETVWYIRHGAGLANGQPNPFSVLLLVLLVGHFVIPFFGLISRTPKRNIRTLAKWGVFLIAMHWLDMIWLVRPELRSADGLTTIAVNWVDVVALLAGLVGLGGLTVAAVMRQAREASLVAEQDPRLDEALAFENF